MSGFVPNFASGLGVSYDRTEPMIGAFVTLQVFRKWGDSWLVDVVAGALESWNDWAWEHRRGDGAFVGPDRKADLIVLGSDPNAAPGGVIGGFNTMQAARYESGLDNSPMYDGVDQDSQGVGPVRFDNISTHKMELYDVGMTSLFLSDTAALIELATARGNTALVAKLTPRLARVTAALNARLWKPDGGPAGRGLYVNALYNGSFYERNSPTALFPLISGAASPAQADALATFAASPRGLCMNTSHTPIAAGVEYVSSWYDGKHDSAQCVSAACTRAVVDAAVVPEHTYAYVRVEGTVLPLTGGPGVGLVQLSTWYSASRNDYALTNSSTLPPDAAGGYQFVRAEGWCWAAPPTGEGGSWPTTPLSLWYSASRSDYKTCGTSACEAGGGGYLSRGVLCFSFDASTATSMPCLYGGNSIAREDAAFDDNSYWRGRVWGPQLMLQWWGLANPAYAGVQSVQDARKSLVAQSRKLLLAEWSNFRRVAENYNGVIGVAEDVENADPMYHWGALPAMMAILEDGKYL